MTLHVIKLIQLSKIAPIKMKPVRLAGLTRQLELSVIIKILLVSYNYLLTDSERRNIIVFYFRCLDSWRMDGWIIFQLSRSVQSHHWHHLLCW